MPVNRVTLYSEPGYKGKSQTFAFDRKIYALSVTRLEKIGSVRVSNWDRKPMIGEFRHTVRLWADRPNRQYPIHRVEKNLYRRFSENSADIGEWGEKTRYIEVLFESKLDSVIPDDTSRFRGFESAERLPHIIE
ncbi:hypothetical protein [Inquilinus sp. CA228]|uniref:hypothetical protein n=1 Tax=Inquilinus sp. CA228 TaxID=3455609 RepID=UPI003F8D7B8C